jgi:hypothetical protein
MTWQERAICRSIDPEIFYQTDPTDARDVCSWCPVSNECAADVLRYESGYPLGQRFGFCGGMTPQERHRLDPKAPRSVKVSISDEARVLRQQLYDAGQPDAEIADRIGTTVAAVRTWRHRGHLAENQPVRVP